MGAPAALPLAVLDGAYAVCRLPAQAEVPAWVPTTGFVSVTHTAEELSIVCAETAVPAEVRSERGFSILKIEGPLDFALTGILVDVASPLADAGISIFALSTFDTDYIMVRSHDLVAAVAVLEAAGHRIHAQSLGRWSGVDSP